ncbi:MAG: 4Fe-4S binding protein [Bacteroidales bacterium]|nr:4Fe-4S binding protein [Bacteroidales bacterium]
MRKKITDLVTVLAIAFVIIAAAVYGKKIAEKNDLNLIGSILKPGEKYEAVNNHKWLLFQESGKVRGRIYSGEGRGYNGNVRVASVTDTTGIILSVHLLPNKETPSFVSKIFRRNFTDRFEGFPISDLAAGEVNIDAVAGATITSNAIQEAIIEAYSAGEGFKSPHRLEINAGWPELLVLLLFTLSVLISMKRLKTVAKYLQWISWVLSVIFLGFVLGQPLTLPRFITVFTGYLPDPSSELYVLLLPVLAIGFILIGGKNNYCRSVCPFGATQELLGAVGKASEIRLKRFRLVKYIQWGISLIAVIIALIMNNPSIAEYSVFGAFFQLTGAAVIFILLMLSISMSLFFRRPWCRYLCPVDGVMAYFRTLRRAVINIFRP